MNKDKSFFEQVYDVVEKIPFGKVTSYGAIAEYLGSKGSSRMVGWALNKSFNMERQIPAHRVVNRIGILTGFVHFGGAEVMKNLLENEGHCIKNNKIQNFEKVFWRPLKDIK